MITVYEYLLHRQPLHLPLIEKRYGRIKVRPAGPDPEDDPNFRYFDKLMRQVPRRGGGSD